MIPAGRSTGISLKDAGLENSEGGGVLLRRVLLDENESPDELVLRLPDDEAVFTGGDDVGLLTN